MSSPDPETIVDVASDAAVRTILDEYETATVEDIDVSITFEAGVLDVDVYLNAGDHPEQDRVVDEAVAEAVAAVDELFEDSVR